MNITHYINNPFIQGFIHLTKMYVDSVNDGGVPCIESAIDVMKRNECIKAYEAALEAYQKVSWTKIRLYFNHL